MLSLSTSIRIRQRGITRICVKIPLHCIFYLANFITIMSESNIFTIIIEL